MQGLPSPGHSGGLGTEEKKKEELERVSRTAGVTDQEAGGRERRGADIVVCYF